MSTPKELAELALTDHAIVVSGMLDPAFKMPEGFGSVVARSITREPELARAVIDLLGENDKLRAKAAMAEEHASWIRRGPPLDHGNTPHDDEWLARWEALK